MRLGARRHPAFGRQVIEIGLEILGAQFARVALAVKQDIVAHPVHIGVCGTRTVMPALAGKTNLVKQAG